MWQGLLALKNDTAAVQLHFVSGNNVLAHRSLPLSDGGPPLRIAQRMRLEVTQLEGVARRMTVRQGLGEQLLHPQGSKARVAPSCLSPWLMGCSIMAFLEWMTKGMFCLHWGYNMPQDQK